MKEQSFYTEDGSGMYFEKITPNVKKQSESLILFHGGAHTGSCYKLTPDGRKGWAYYFAEKGFEVYIPDWPGTGRSRDVALEKINGEFLINAFSTLIEKIDGKVILITHSMSGAYGWKLAEIYNEKVVKVIGTAPSPMGNIQKISEIVEHAGNNLSMNFNGRNIDLNMETPYICDENFIDKKFIGVSSKFFPRDQRDNYVSLLQTIAPKLFYERFNVKDSQMKIDVSNLRHIKILVITGTEDFDHPRELDEYIVKYLKENGVSADYIYLGDRNITGNGHMMMLESNSDSIAEIIFQWIINN
jgi:pimeloyl-ACP methyl ester carboxylesterase